MIIDSHAHVFPHLDGPSGFATKDEQRLRLQHLLSQHRTMPVRRARDGAIVTTPTLWDPHDPTASGRWDVSFRATRMGRMEWRHQGEDYYVQFMPPSLQENTAPPELLLAAMDLAGVDRAVLQYGYGNVNEHFADAIRRYPTRFYGLGGPREDTDDVGAGAEHAAYLIEDLGLHGILYQNILHVGPVRYDEPAYDPLWREVARLHVPVWWIIRGREYADVWHKFTRWCDRHAGIPSVIVQGIPEAAMVERGTIRLPDYVVQTVQRHHVYVEICYAITHGIWEEYPFPRTNEMVRELYYRLGPQKLVWGSDFPNVERLCTYAQSLNHVKNHCPFIAPTDMEAILGGNLSQLFAPTRPTI